MTAALGRMPPVVWAILLAPLGALSVLLADRTSPVLPVAVLLGLVAALLAYENPLTSLLVGLALVPLERFAVPLGALTLSPTELVLMLTAAAWVLRRVTSGERPWPSTPLAWPVLLLWLAVIPGLSVAEDTAGALRVLMFWGTFVLLFAMIATEGDAAYVRRLLFVIALVGAAVGISAAAGTAGTQQQLSSLGDTATGRAVGAFGDPNILATFLAMALPASVLVAFEGRWRRRPLALIAATLIVMGLALSLSRGGIAAAGGAMLVLMAWAPVRRTALAGVLVLVAISVIGKSPLGNVQQAQLVLDRVQSVRLASGSSGADQRQLVYRETPRIISDYWLTGIGALNYPRVAPRYGIVDPRSGLTYVHAHNVALTIGAELGVLGLVALVWLLLATARLMARVCAPRAGPLRGPGLAVTGALVALGLQGVVDYTLRSNIISALAAVLLGALAVLACEQPEPAPEPQGAPVAAVA